MKTILFVCTGNTCRSSMAESLFRHMLENHKGGVEDIRIISAGTSAWEGQCASPQAIEVLKEKGIDLGNHRSTPLTPALIEGADLILTMTWGHKARVLRMHPQAIGKVFTLKEYAFAYGEESLKKEANLGSTHYDIQDPFGQSVAVYRQSANEIEVCLQKLLKKFLK